MTSVLLLTAPIAAPLLASATTAIIGRRRATAWLTVGSATVILACGIIAGTRTVGGTALTVGHLLRVDALSAVMLLVIGAVALIATWASVDYIDDELATGHTDARRARTYGTLVPLFLATMVTAVCANNLGVLWAAIEATTIVTAFLVGHAHTRRSLEATWKYVIICSVGIALAYLGTVLVYYAARQSGIDSSGALDMAWLTSHANHLDQGVMRIAFALVVLGFGTKAGLVPMHSWLPDAHSEAPAPVSALMSGVLLSVAAYALIRYRLIAVSVLDPTFVRGVLLAVALASLLLSASLMVLQHNYKRLLAYSSIEHMGFIVIGIAAGTPLAIAAALLHMLGQGLTKAVLFCGSGQILSYEGTREIGQIRGLLTRRPALAATFALGIAALLGLPPFSLFASELGLARATTGAGLGWVLAVALVLMLVVFVSMAATFAPMLLGTGLTEQVERTPTARPASTAPLVTGLIAVAALGTVSWPLEQLLRAAGGIVGTP